MTDSRVVVELAKELASLLVIANLGKLECDSSTAVLRALGLLDGEANSVKDSSGGLSCRLTIRDGNNQDGLAHLSATDGGYNDAIDDLLAELSAHGCKSAELVALNELLDLLLVLNVLDHVLRGVVVHEADRDAIIIEEGSGGCDTLEDKLEILDTLAVLLELHGATVVNVENNIVQGQLDNVVADLLVDAPLLAQSVDLARGSVGNLIDYGRAGRVEGLEALLLDGLLERLLVCLDLSRACGLRRRSTVAALRTAWLLSRISALLGLLTVATLLGLRRVATLLLRRCAIAALLTLWGLALEKTHVSKRLGRRYEKQRKHDVAKMSRTYPGGPPPYCCCCDPCGGWLCPYEG